VVSNEDLRDIFTVLKKQKEGLDLMSESISDSTRQLMVMERELDSCSKSGPKSGFKSHNGPKPIEEAF